MAPIVVASRAILASDNQNGITQGFKIGSTGAAGHVRLDASTHVEGFSLRATATNATVRGAKANGLDDLRDLLFTVGKSVGDSLTHKVRVMGGYDAGVREALAGAKYDTAIDGRDLQLKGYWFQGGNLLRGEAGMRINANNSLWGAYTHGTDAVYAPSSFINFRLRDQMLIAPFTVPIANRAAKYSFKKDKVLADVSVDFGRNAAFLEVAGEVASDLLLKGGYAFKTNEALVEVVRAARGDAPRVRAYVKSAMENITKPAVGLILERAFTF